MTIDKLGHSYENGVCTRCGKELESEIGNHYIFAGYVWILAEQPSSNHVVLQSKGVTSGYWPGCSMSKFIANEYGYYSNSIDGQDISDYNQKTKDLYNAIKSAEYTSATYGKGLFLVSRDKCESNSDNNYYNMALKSAADHDLTNTNHESWLGTAHSHPTSAEAWVVYYSGDINTEPYHRSSIVAPAFNLDVTKVKFIGNNIVIK